MWDLAAFILCVGVNIKNKMEVLYRGICYFLLVLQMAEFAQSAKAARKVHNERENYTKNGRNYARDKLVLPPTKGQQKLLQLKYPYLRTSYFCS